MDLVAHVSLNDPFQPIASPKDKREAALERRLTFAWEAA
jgi:hypothetical protein